MDSSSFLGTTCSYALEFISGLKEEVAFKTTSLWYSWNDITRGYENNEI
jgi:hypothetical protein